MTRAYFYQEQFNFGQLGKLLRARSDIGLYKKGCKILKNFRPSIQGPAIKRKGAVYSHEVKDSSQQVLLQKFIFSEIDSYVLEFGDQTLRFIQGTSQVESASVPYEIATPYSVSDLPKLKFAQIGDIMYIAHPSYPPYKLSRFGNTNWTLAAMEYKLGPIQDVNETSTTITVTGTKTEGGTSTWTASSSIFQSTDVGTVWGIREAGADHWHYGKMTSYTSGTVADFENQNDLTHLVSGTTEWAYPAWSETYGFPRAVAFHEQRLFFGGNDNAPLTVWGSVIRAFENFDIGTAATDDALVFDLSGRKNNIQWLASDGEFLVSGTYGGLGFVQFDIGADTVEPRARVGTTYGSSSKQGVLLGDKLVYAHSNEKSIYETNYDDISLKYISANLNNINSDIISSSISKLDVIEQPDLTLACVNGGKLILCSRLSQGEENITGWYEYSLNGEIEDVCIIPTTEDDRIFIAVKRTINGNTKRYIEYIETADVMRYLDSSIYYSGSATRTFTGLNHLEGETVQVYGDGSFFGEYVVSSGSITIPTSKTAIEEAYIGLAYQADLETMPISMGFKQTGGTTQTLDAKIDQLRLMLYKTLTLSVGRDFDNLDVIPFRKTNDAMTAGLELFGGDYPDIKETMFSQGYTKQPSICLRSELPFPCTIVSIFGRMEVNAN